MSRFKKLPEEKNSGFAYFFLALYTLFIFIRPHEMFPQSNDWILIKVLAILSLLGTLFAQRPLKVAPQVWMFTALLPLIIVSGFLNGWGAYGIEQAQKLLISSIIPLFLFTVLITSISKQEKIMLICIVAAMIMVANGHYQQTHTFGWTTESMAMMLCRSCPELRIAYLGFFSDPNDLGMFLVMNIPFTMYFFFKKGTINKILFGCVLATLFYGIYITHSRGTMLGAGSLLAIYYLVMSAGPKLFIASAICAPIAATVITALQGDVDASAMGRLDAWYFGLQQLFVNPVFGIGKGNFVEEHGLTAHNSYVLVAAELGIPGYSLWGGALLFTVLTGFLIIKSNKKNKPSDDDEVLTELRINKALFFSMAGYLVTAFFISRTYTLLLFVFLGMMIASNIRLTKLVPAYTGFVNPKLIWRCIGFAWIIIIVVYIALKLGLR